MKCYIRLGECSPEDHASAGEHGVSSVIKLELKLERGDAAMESPGHKTQTGHGPVSPAGSAFDYERSLARLGGDPVLFREIVQLFLEDSPRLLERARTSLQQRNLPELERAAHSLKGLSVNFEARELAAAALTVEQHARDGDLERAAACFPELESKFETLQAELADFQRSQGHGDDRPT